MRSATNSSVFDSLIVFYEGSRSINVQSLVMFFVVILVFLNFLVFSSLMFSNGTLKHKVVFKRNAIGSERVIGITTTFIIVRAFSH